MKVYVDSSILLRILLRAEGAMEHPSNWQFAVTSDLLEVEVLRTLDRARVNGKLDDAGVANLRLAFYELTAVFQKIPLQPAILKRAASPFPTLIRTLDAIHLATALLWVEQNEEPLTVLTHDAELALAARACGLDVRP